MAEGSFARIQGTVQTFHEQSLNVLTAMTKSYDGSRREAETGSLNSFYEGGNGTIMGAIFIMLNAVLGASVLVLPFSYGQIGLYTAIIIEVFVTVISYLAHIILADAIDRHGGSNYQELVGRVCGPVSKMSAQVFLFLYTFGVGCATLITIGDQLQKVCMFIDNTSTPSSWYCHRPFLTPTVAMVTIFPLIWFRNISSFSYASVLSVASCIYLIVAVIVDFYAKYEMTEDNIWMPGDVSWVQILQYIPVFTIGFQCHMTSVPLYSELTRRSVSRYSVVVTVSNATTLLCYVLCGMYGLFTFGRDVQSDVILDYSPSDKLMTISRGAIAISVIASFPIFTFLGRGALEDTIVETARRFAIPVTENSEVRRVVMLFAWFGTALLVSCFVDTLDQVMAIVGSFASLFMCFYPGQILWYDSERNTPLRLVAVLFMGYGLFVFVWTIGFNVYTFASG